MKLAIATPRSQIISRQIPANPEIVAVSNSPQNRYFLHWVGSATAAIWIAVTLLIGMHLLNSTWRYRKQNWQLQGGLAGAAVGNLIGS